MSLYTKLLILSVTLTLNVCSANVIKLRTDGDAVAYSGDQQEQINQFISPSLSGSRHQRSMPGRIFSISDSSSGRNIVSWFAPRSSFPAVQCTATNGALDMGTCYTEAECEGQGGVSSGDCATGGVCCVFPTVCGGVVSRNRTWFVNKDFPEYSTDSEDCELTIRRSDNYIKQVRLDFRINELGDALQGECLMDVMKITRAGSSRDLMPQLCGNNNAQHVYISFGFQDLKLQINLRGEQRRKWHILITTVAPSTEVEEGCLQYYADRTAIVKSLNYNSGSYLYKGNMDYDICFPPANAFSQRGDKCERVAKDIDLRQSENDIRTKKRFQRKFGGGPFRRYPRRGRQLNVVMTYDEDHILNSAPLTFASSDRSRKYRPQTISQAYSLVTDHLYSSQIDKVKSQLKHPESTSGLETLLNSKSELDQMKDDFGQSLSGDEDVYYYYYYEDDFLKNELNGGMSEPVTDNYAVEHSQKEFVVLPDGSPVPSSFFTHRPTTFMETTQNPKKSYTQFRKSTKSSATKFPTTMKDPQEYFHTGMLQDLFKKAEEEQQQQQQPEQVKFETQYPVPTYFQRPTTTPSISEGFNTYPGASIYVFDPLPDLKNKNSVINKFTTRPIPFIKTTNDFTTTLSPPTSIEDELILKHDGVQWLFLNNNKMLVNSPEYEDILSKNKETTAEVTLPTQPHIVFKHPSGKVTEMLVEDSEDGNPGEKLVTVIETDELTQNLTKFKIDNISELDRVIEAVFDVLEDTNTKNPTTSTKKTSIIQKTTRPTLFDTTYTKSPQTTYVTLSAEGVPIIRNKYAVVTSPNEVYEAESTSAYKEPELTVQTIPTTIFDRFTNRPTTPKYKSNILLTTRPRPNTIIYKKNKEVPQVVDNSDVSTIPNLLSVFGTDIPVQLFNSQNIETSSTSEDPEFTTLQEFLSKQSDDKKNKIEAIVIEEVEEPTSPLTFNTVTNSPIILTNTNAPGDAFTTMLNNLRGIRTTIGPQQEESEEETSPQTFTSPTPIFKISTTTNGIITTKTYSTIEDALNDLQTVSNTKTNTDVGVTEPMSYNVQQSTQVSVPSSTENYNINIEDLSTDSSVLELNTINEVYCRESFIKVNGLKICDSLLRSESIRNQVQDLFTNMERISIHSVGDSGDPLRFSLTYDTVCSGDPSGLAKTSSSNALQIGSQPGITLEEAPVKTISLLQYLLGWY